MKVIGIEKLEKFSKKHANAKPALDAWREEARAANWTSFHDIKKRYGSADHISEQRVIFNIKGNDYRLVVRVRYRNGIVVIEWVGTHAEYDKQNFRR